MAATLSGTLFLYQGEEIGMTNIPEAWSVKDLKDTLSIHYWNRMQEQHRNNKKVMTDVWRGIVENSRDNARTPVQWSSEKNAGCMSLSFHFYGSRTDALPSHYWNPLDEG